MCADITPAEPDKGLVVLGGLGVRGAEPTKVAVDPPGSAPAAVLFGGLVLSLFLLATPAAVPSCNLISVSFRMTDNVDPIELRRPPLALVMSVSISTPPPGLVRSDS